MAFGVYKPGQGYWTRVMTAVGLGGIALAGGAWLATQIQSFDVGVEPIIIKGAVVGGVSILSAIVIYWICGLHRRTNEFFIAVEGEMQKVNWSTRREVLGSTWVVIGVSVIIAIILFVTDLLFSAFFRSIDLLQTS